MMSHHHPVPTNAAKATAVTSSSSLPLPLLLLTSACIFMTFLHLLLTGADASVGWSQCHHAMITPSAGLLPPRSTPYRRYYDYLLSFFRTSSPSSPPATTPPTTDNDNAFTGPQEPPGAVRICREGFIAISYDTTMLTPAFSQYHITTEDVGDAIGGREAFYEDPDLESLGVMQASVNSHIFGETWNRGHCAPSRIMSFSRNGKHAAYTMANIAPQGATFNQQPWEQLETRVFDWLKGSSHSGGGGGGSRHRSNSSSSRRHRSRSSSSRSGSCNGRSSSGSRSGCRSSRYDDTKTNNAAVTMGDDATFNVNYGRVVPPPTPFARDYIIEVNTNKKAASYYTGTPASSNNKSRSSNSSRRGRSRSSRGSRSSSSSKTNTSRSLYIITGVAYKDRSRVARGPDAIAYPDYYFKVLCDAAARQSVGFYGVNEPSTEQLAGYFVPVSTIERDIYGGDLFPKTLCRTNQVNPKHWWTPTEEDGQQSQPSQSQQQGGGASGSSSSDSSHHGYYHYYPPYYDGPYSYYDGGGGSGGDYNKNDGYNNNYYHNNNNWVPVGQSPYSFHKMLKGQDGFVPRRSSPSPIRYYSHHQYSNGLRYDQHGRHHARRRHRNYYY